MGIVLGIKNLISTNKYNSSWKTREEIIINTSISGNKEKHWTKFNSSPDKNSTRNRKKCPELGTNHLRNKSITMPYLMVKKWISLGDKPETWSSHLSVMLEVLAKTWYYLAWEPMFHRCWLEPGSYLFAWLMNGIINSHGHPNKLPRAQCPPEWHGEIQMDACTHAIEGSLCQCGLLFSRDVASKPALSQRSTPSFYK